MTRNAIIYGIYTLGVAAVQAILFISLGESPLLLHLAAVPAGAAGVRVGGRLADDRSLTPPARRAEREPQPSPGSVICALPDAILVLYLIALVIKSTAER